MLQESRKHAEDQATFMQCINAGTDKYLDITVNKNIRLKPVLWTLQQNGENPSIGQFLWRLLSLWGSRFCSGESCAFVQLK